MLIEFSVGNYRSFKDAVTFSMLAANLVAQNREVDTNNVFEIKTDLKLLKSAAIYGANASGKSNLIHAFNFMKKQIINSSKESQSNEKIKIEPFLLDTESAKLASYFEIAFIYKKIIYRYGFEANENKIKSEWLYYIPSSRETLLFERKDQKFTHLAKKLKAESLKQFTRPNALFLSVCAQFNIKIAKDIVDWIDDGLAMISGAGDLGYSAYTSHCIKENGDYKNKIIPLIKELDTGINDILIEEYVLTEELLPESLPEVIKQDILRKERTVFSVATSHKKYDKQKKLVGIEQLDLENHESEGTQKLFALAGPIINVLDEGTTLIVDELDAQLHPLITLKIISLFNSRITNPNNAQLIFTTHDTNLLNNKTFRRDQIWFSEKNIYGITDLYSLAEYKIDDESSVRNDASFERDYIRGKYGAIPYIGDIEHIFS